MQLQLLDKHPTTKKKEKKNNIISNRINNVYYLYISCLIYIFPVSYIVVNEVNAVIKFILDYFP